MLKYIYFADCQLLTTSIKKNKNNLQHIDLLRLIRMLNYLTFWKLTVQSAKSTLTNWFIGDNKGNI